MVQSNGAIHQVAIGADLCHVLEDLEGLIRAEGAGRVGGDCLHVVDAGGRSQCGPQHALKVAGVDALIGKQCDTLFLGLVAQFKEVIPGHRRFPAVLFEQSLVVNQTHRAGIKRGNVDLAVAVRRALGGIQQAIDDLILQRGVIINAALLKDIGQIHQRMFLNHGGNQAGGVVVVHRDEVGHITCHDLRADDVANLRADLHIDSDAGIGILEAFDDFVPVRGTVAALEHRDVQFIVLKGLLTGRGFAGSGGRCFGRDGLAGCCCAGRCCAAAACQTGSCHCSGKHHADCFFHGFPPKNYSFFVWDAAHLSFPDCTLIISGKPDLINVFPLLKDGFY